MQVIEMVQSRQTSHAGADSSRTLNFMIWQVTTQEQALGLLNSTAPATYSDGVMTLFRATTEVIPMLAEETTTDTLVFKGVATYRVKHRANEEYCLDQFDTTGGTEHRRQSIRTISNSNNRADKRWMHGAINVDDERVNGLDITAPAYTHTRNCKVPDQTVDQAFRQMMMEYTGTVNSEAFIDWDPGEGLFLGARGVDTGDGFWDLELTWKISKNEEIMFVGDIAIEAPADPTTGDGPAELRPDIPLPFQNWDKLGWEYGWIWYDWVDGPDGGAGPETRVKKAVDVYIEQVYPYKDHNDLIANLPAVT